MPHEPLVTAMPTSLNHSNTRDSEAGKDQSTGITQFLNCQVPDWEEKNRVSAQDKKTPCPQAPGNCTAQGMLQEKGFTMAVLASPIPAPLNLTPRQNIQLTVHICLGHQLIVQGSPVTQPP